VLPPAVVQATSPQDPAAVTVDAVLRRARSSLLASGFATTREAALLLGRVLGLSEAQILARGDETLAPAAVARFRRLLEARLAGEPVAYLLAEREFYGRVFAVDRRVLIPRPETEHVVEAALGLGLPPAPRILDVGTGSGCLAITLALELPGARVVASDLSPAALALAAANARRLGAAAQVSLVAADLLAACSVEPFDLVVSNPPYIDLAEAPALPREVCNFEPHLALFSPGRGDSTLARLLAECGGLRPGAAVIVEIGFGQQQAVRGHAAAAGLETIEVRADYAGVPRVVVMRRPAGDRGRLGSTPG
jgi:release factor glutamine methyltransferase